MDNASVSIMVQPMGHVTEAASSAAVNSAKPPAASAIRLTAEPSLSDPGLYQATYIPRQTGGYRAEATVINSVGAEVGRTEAGWSSDPAADEFRSLKPNRSLLEEIAKKTGGEVIPLKQLDAFAAGLPQRKVPITEAWTFPIWHQPFVFLFALACFIAEWGLRRAKGLA
jgi:hypothetical protein